MKELDVLEMEDSGFRESGHASPVMEPLIHRHRHAGDWLSAMIRQSARVELELSQRTGRPSRRQKSPPYFLASRFNYYKLLIRKRCMQHLNVVGSEDAT